MGISAFVTDFRGRKVSEGVLDPSNALRRLLPPSSDTTFHCLRFIDRYGDTVFNRLQVPVLLTELDSVRATAESGREVEILDSLRSLAERALLRPGLYLTFYGD